MGILGLAIFVKAACELIVVCVARAFANKE